MSRITTPVALLIAAILAVLLIAYVFLGGNSSPAQAKARCASAETYQQVKMELFRRAAVTRRGTEPGFTQVANYAVLRAASPAVRKAGEKDGEADCTADLVLDLPPGVEVVGGRRSLTGKVGYSVRSGAGGQSQLDTLGAADAIVIPLASIRRTGSDTGNLVPTQQPEMTEEVPDEIQEIAPDERDVIEQQPAPAPPPPRTVERPSPPRSTTSSQSTRPRPAPERREQTAAAEPKPKPKPAAPPSTTTAAARPVSRPPANAPSFNCRNARTRGEIAVCSDPGLASLDREMSRQFYGALSGASPGARAMLQRSRSRFLRYRDSCTSPACMAEAYRGRMQEIDEIASGRY
jgi:hypothetical protein